MKYLLLSILCSAAMLLAMRISEGRVKSKTSMIAVNYLTCLIMAGCLIGGGAVFPDHPLMSRTLVLGVVNGVCYMTDLLLMQYNIQRNGIVLPSVFSRIGALLVPLATAVFLFGEFPTLLQIAGAALAVVAIVMLNFRENAGTVGDTWALIGLLLLEGLAAAMSKVYNVVGSSELSLNFLLFTFGSAFVFCILVILRKKERPGLREIGFGILVGVPNFAGSRLILKALETVPAFLVYPMRSVSTIVIITLAGTLLFHEKLTRRQLLAMGMILVALILLNV